MLIIIKSLYQPQSLFLFEPFVSGGDAAEEAYGLTDLGCEVCEECGIDTVLLDIDASDFKARHSGSGLAIHPDGKGRSSAGSFVAVRQEKKLCLL